MTIQRRADLVLPAVLDDLAGNADPDYLDDVLLATSRTRQRRVAASIQRRLPVFDTAGASAVGTRLPWRGLALALLIIALLVASLVLVAGAIRNRPAPPFGLAATGLVAFEEGGDIVATMPDGTRLRTLIGGPGVQWGLVWSHRGDRFAYWSAPTASEGSNLQGSPASLWVADGDGSGRHQISREPITGANDFFPSASWSPDDRQLAFARDGVLYVVNADGTGLHSVGDQSHARDLPVWSPDGTLIAYTGHTGAGDTANYTSLWVMTPDGRDDHLLIDAQGGYEIGVNSNASWSPDSTSLLVHTGGAELVPNQIWIAHRDAAGSWHSTDVVQGALANFLPAWSTTGTRFTFIQAVDEASTQFVVMVADADGSNPHLLSSQQVKLSTTCWSPDDRFVRAVALDGSPVLLPLDASRPIEIAAGDGATAGCYMQRRAP